MGSKNRIAKDILPIILKNRKDDQYYVEPFVGGANIIDKVDGLRIGSDFNLYIADMWKELEAGWLPPQYVIKDHYQDVISNMAKYENYHVGYIGVACSYSGKWFGGFAGRVETKEGLRDYQAEAYKNLLKQLPNIKGIDFRHSSYCDLIIPPNSIIYCDPPYLGTTGYSNDFDHIKFYEWCRSMAAKGHKVYISEYYMPDDFECVWEKEVKSSLSANGKSGGNKISIEKLFTI